MEPAIPWYQSKIIQQQVVAFLVAAFGLFKISTDLDVSATVTAIFAGVAALIPVWTILTRLFRPSPNLTATAANKEASLKASGDLPTVSLKQGGFVRASLIVFLGMFSMGVVAVSLPGCVGTQAAFHAASSVSDTAYVVEEEYSALVKEAADLAQSPTIDPQAKAAMKAADAAVKPWILGDEATGKPGLRKLAATYAAVKDAKTQADLQAAIDGAVIELTKLINAVKSARR